MKEENDLNISPEGIGLNFDKCYILLHPCPLHQTVDCQHEQEAELVKP